MRQLTVKQTEAIGFLLHEHIQFYEQNGKPANAEVITEIERVLTEENI